MEQIKYIYNKTREVNKERFAELLVKAKGDRSMRTFAAACGANPSTFTRITQKVNKGASSPELLEAIAANADPQSGVTLEQLAEVNGYSLAKSSVLFSTPHHSLRADIINRTRLARDIIIQEFLDRNHDFTLCSHRHRISELYPYCPDMLIRTSTFGRQEELWSIDCIFETIGPHDSASSTSPKRDEAFHRIADYTLMGISRNAGDIPIRFSLAVFNPNVYISMLQRFSEIPVPIHLSLILIDTVNGCVQAENMLGLSKIEHEKSFFMSIPKNDSTSNLRADDYDTAKHFEDFV